MNRMNAQKAGLNRNVDNHAPFSVSMCVYEKDNPQWFDRALESVAVEQTVKPFEIVLVVDGPVPPEIDDVIFKYAKTCDERHIFFNVIRLEKNQGHGNARRRSVSSCSTEIIAIMDADDVSDCHRFQTQLPLLNQGIDICGGNIAEFIGEESNIVSHRNVPVEDDAIKEFAKKRCPFNQVTVMFKKKVYEKAGGYMDWYQDEDYYLWLRMMKIGAVFANTGSVLVNVRIGDKMYQRRGGLKYYRSERKLQKYMLKEKMISLPRYVLNCSMRFVIQVLMPSRMRGWFFKKMARS